MLIPPPSYMDAEHAAPTPNNPEKPGFWARVLTSPSGPGPSPCAAHSQLPCHLRANTSLRATSLPPVLPALLTEAAGLTFFPGGRAATEEHCTRDGKPQV